MTTKKTTEDHIPEKATEQPTNNWPGYPKSYIKEGTTKDGKIEFFGRHFYQGAEFRFTLTQQTSSPHVTRGTISVISPKDGLILQVDGKEKEAILRQLNAMKPGYVEAMNGKRIPELNITSSIYSDSLDIEKVRHRVEMASKRMFKEHALRIFHVMGEISRPTTITPIVAAHKNVDKYLEKNHPSLSEVSRQKYRNDILKTCAELPHIPMANFTLKTLSKHFKETNLSKTNQKLLKKFWTYCLQAKVCTGTPPFPPEEKKRVRTKGKPPIPTMLSLDEEDKLFDSIKETCSGGDCGIALQVWGGYSAHVACSFAWKDVIFDDTDFSYVRIAYRRDDLTGAVHNFRAPLFIAGGEILHRRYLQLKHDYGKTKALAMPVVSQITDPTKPMTPNQLIQYSRMHILAIGITYKSLAELHQKEPKTAVSSLILLNTYANNLYVRCLLSEDPGVASFLEHRPVLGVTDSHYADLANDEANELFHAVLSTVRPEEEIAAAENDTPVLRSDGKEEYCFWPRTTRECVGVVGNIILKPGEEIIIKCPHGVTGSVSAREILEDGSLRRKSPHTKKKRETS